MKLFHFCCDHVAPRVRIHGLSNGSLTLVKRQQFHVRRGYQWLTSDPDFDAQRWADPAGLLRCDRTDYRFTINLPDENTPLGTLRDWPTTKKLMELLGTRVEDIVLAFERPGSASWYTWEGKIPTSWILAVDENPKHKPSARKDSEGYPA